MVRDAMLFLSGHLDPAMFGPPVPIHLTEFMEGRGRPGSSGPLDGEGRRSIYLEVRRNFIPAMMRTFDTPVPFTTIGKRKIIPNKYFSMCALPHVSRINPGIFYRVWTDWCPS